ncbi:efflux RND transporter periplasmic adaptor subunit [Paucibacter sp. APW11]|uniref:Efflux RND transporter periplasmic adaptor subunit n=1 Tax=Roseateles aquae TaxID=3077235 RepID=A0ABU3PAU6_9BURK|nr:efflux RND transporter periplasmic adaptor subunit [Paucibacter sp. APW11]MDT8999706.1 efflux RND transporter periplasmic adaptor subunit [Paucibacter sp. APW11]
MTITKQQKTLMAALVAAGLIASGAVLWSGRGTAPAPDQGHTHEDESKPHGKGDPGQPDAGHEQERVIKLSAEQQKTAGVAVASAGSTALQAASDFSGEIRFNDDRTAHVVPRLAGVAEGVTANLGQQVRAGQVLAVIASTSLSEQRSELLTAQRRQEAALATYEREKKLWQEKISAEQDYLQAQSALREAAITVDNARQKLAAIGASASTSSLNRFEVKAPFDGTVVEKHLSRGEAVREDASIFTVSDLSSVWAEFAVAPKDLAVVRVGQKVIVSSSAFEERVQGAISYVGSLLGEQTRTARARVTLANPQGAWRPGLFVTVSVLGAEQQVPIAVPAEAIQTIEKQSMVFKAVPGGFQPMPVKTGRADGKSVEVLQGLKAGDKVATVNAFVLKSELGKAGAEHEH